MDTEDNMQGLLLVPHRPTGAQKSAFHCGTMFAHQLGPMAGPEARPAGAKAPTGRIPRHFAGRAPFGRLRGWPCLRPTSCWLGRTITAVLPAAAHQLKLCGMNLCGRPTRTACCILFCSNSGRHYHPWTGLKPGTVTQLLRLNCSAC